MQKNQINILGHIVSTGGQGLSLSSVAQESMLTALVLFSYTLHMVPTSQSWLILCLFVYKDH